METKQYIKPCCLKEVEILLERDFLNASPVREVRIVGQEVESHDFTGITYNHDWDSSVNDPSSVTWYE